MREARVSARSIGVAWLLCLLPRAAVVLAAWPAVRLDTSSVLFVDGAIKTNLSDAFWPPCYGLFASSVWWLSGHRPACYLAEHLAVHALIGPAVWWLSASLSLSRRAGWIAVLGVACLPYYVMTAVRQLDVGVVIAVAGASVAGFAWWLRRPARPGALAGIGCALLAFLFFLIRSNAISLIAAMYVLAGRRQTPRHVGLSLGVFLALMLGLALVDGARFGHVTPFPANLGYNLFVGNNPNATAYLARRDVEYSTVAFDHSEMLPDRPEQAADQYGADAALSRYALGYLVAHPADTLHGMALKFLRYWDVDLGDSPPHSRLQKLGYALPYLAYLPLAAAGLVVLRRTGRDWAAMMSLVVIAAYFVPHLAAFGTIRMRMTVEFVLMVLAATALDAWWRHIELRTSKFELRS